MKKKSKKSSKLLKKHPEWFPKSVTHKSMLEDGYVGAFRVKRDGFEKDEIWYRR